jgi:hypothetical protein
MLDLAKEKQMSSQIFNISRDKATNKVIVREAMVDDCGDPVFTDTGEKVPDDKLKGYMSSVFNPNFHPPYQSPTSSRQ